MKVNYNYPKKNDIIFVTPFIGCDYSDNSFSICIGFLFLAIKIEF